jgi:ribosomal protein L7/L12
VSHETNIGGDADHRRQALCRTAKQTRLIADCSVEITLRCNAQCDGHPGREHPPRARRHGERADLAIANCYHRAMQTISDRIATRAYERFLARGREHGHDVEDWLAAEAELTRTPCDIVLAHSGPNTIELVRALRDLTGLGLPEIRTLVDTPPGRIQRVESVAAAERFRTALEPLGARVEIQVVKP